MAGYISAMTASAALTGDELVEVSQLSATVEISGTTISAQASDNSFNDSGSGFVAAGFAVNDRVNVVGFTGDVANNIFAATITALTAGKMTIGGTDGDVIVDDAAGEIVSIIKWETRRTTAQEIVDLANAGAGPLTVSTQAGTSYTAVLADAQTYILFTNGSAVTFTIPPNSSEAFPIGSRISFEQNGAGVVTVTAGGGVTLHSRGSLVATAGQYAVAAVQKVATDTWTIIGDVA